MRENNEEFVPKKKIKSVNVPKEVKPKSNKALIIILTIIFALALLVVAYLVFFKKDTMKEEDKKEDNTQIVDPKEEQEEVSVNTNELIIYKYVEDGLLMEDKADDTVEAFRIKVASKDSKIVTIYQPYMGNNSFVLYNDNGLYLYDVNNKTSQKISLEDGYDKYELITDESFNKVIGIGYLKPNNTVGYYNVLKNKKLYDGKYKATITGGEYYLEFRLVNNNYIRLDTSNGVYLLNTNEEKEQLFYKHDSGFAGSHEYVEYGSGDKQIYVLEECMSDYCSIINIYDNDFKLIYNAHEMVSDNRFSVYNNYIYLVELDKDDKYIIKKLDLKGNVLSTINKDSAVYMISRNYYIYLNDNKLTIENIDDSSESKVLIDWKESYNFNEYDSGYYSKSLLNELNEKDKKEGIYIVVEYGYSKDSPIKDSKGYYGIEFCYTPDKQVIEYPIKEIAEGRAKPVLYLYPEKETNVTVTFMHPEYLTTTYPKYQNSWNVRVLPNGDMYDKDGKYYYALYWDETRYSEVDFHEGFYVEADDAIKFLEDKLTYIGLSKKERNEFIMYWLPIMEKNGKNLVYFELTKEREANNKLIITPKPDSLLRVSIHIKKVDKKVNIKEQKLETFNRTGFSAVEWGGMTY